MHIGWFSRFKCNDLYWEIYLPESVLSGSPLLGRLTVLSRSGIYPPPQKGPGIPIPLKDIWDQLYPSTHPVKSSRDGDCTLHWAEGTWDQHTYSPERGLGPGIPTTHVNRHNYLPTTFWQALITFVLTLFCIKSNRFWLNFL